jgi:hypothetical protein
LKLKEFSIWIFFRKLPNLKTNKPSDKEVTSKMNELEIHGSYNLKYVAYRKINVYTF